MGSKQTVLAWIGNFHGSMHDSPDCLVGVSGSEKKPAKPFKPMLGVKSSLIWIFGGSVGRCAE